MEYYTRHVKTSNEEGMQVWCGDRPADGEKIYPSRQNAYVAKDRLQSSSTWIDCKVTIRVEQKDFEPVVEHIEKRFHRADVLVCIPYKDSFFKVRTTPVVDIAFRLMCRPEDTVFVGPGSWLFQPMTYNELSEWLKEVDETFPIVQNSTIDKA